MERCLAPALRPGDIEVMDDVGPTRGPRSSGRSVQFGAEVRLLPAYSPDHNPIEGMSGKLKEFLRSAAARTVATPIDAMGEALRSVTPDDGRGWCGHRGYRYAQE
ncbi:hypothetical protein AB1L88_17695 [Tautonia sp. JC769]|uniref:hypothetical protein n=1 Tax=Tautonia sp. JC769 TaxID=3232135 RepID=UPI003458ED84